MGVETVLLGLLGLVAVWLVIDAGRERHRLRARVARDERWQAERRRRMRWEAREARAASPDSWRYWPLTLPSVEDSSSGPRL
jgi:hypothetical protein